MLLWIILIPSIICYILAWRGCGRWWYSLDDDGVDNSWPILFLFVILITITAPLYPFAAIPYFLLTKISGSAEADDVVKFLIGMNRAERKRKRAAS